MGDEADIKPKRGNDTFTNPEKRARVTRMLTVGMDGMAYSQMKKNEAEREEGYERHFVVDQITEAKFEGTDVPLSMLFIYFSRGQSYKEFMATYPDVKEEEVLTVIDIARYGTTGEGFSTVKEMIALRRDVERLNQNTGTNFKRLFDSIKNLLQIK